MKRLLLSLVSGLLYLLPYTSMGQITAPFTESFGSSTLPTGWTTYNSISSTNVHTFWETTASCCPNYGAQGQTNNPGSSGTYAMWVDASVTNTAGIIVSIETDSIDVSSLTAPYAVRLVRADDGVVQFVRASSGG